MALLDLVERRLVIVTGKGGVGKTTIAASLARAFARKGKRVLVSEIAPAEDTPSALSTPLGTRPLTDEPYGVAHNIHAALLTPSMGHKRFLQDTLPIKLIADAAMKSQGLRRFLSAAPGFSDMGVMYRMLDLLKKKHPDGGNEYDICIVDSPATGHAMALAQIPELLVRIIPGGPIHRAASEGIRFLTDPGLCSTVVVTLPETLPVTESLELRAGLQKHKLPKATLVVNRIPADPFSPEDRAQMKAELSKGRVFGDREIMRIDRSVAAIDLLKQQAEGWIELPDLELHGTDLAAELSQRLSA